MLHMIPCVSGGMPQGHTRFNPSLDALGWKTERCRIVFGQLTVFSRLEGTGGARGATI
jgi:hypothetical protein